MKKYSQKYSERICDYNVIQTAIEVINNGLPHLLVISDSRAVYKLDSRLQNKSQLTVVYKAFSKGTSGLSVLRDMLILTNCGCDISIISMNDGSRKDYNIPNTTCIHSICSHKNGHIVTLESSKGQESKNQVLEGRNYTSYPLMVSLCIAIWFNFKRSHKYHVKQFHVPKKNGPNKMWPLRLLLIIVLSSVQLTADTNDATEFWVYFLWLLVNLHTYAL